MSRKITAISANTSPKRWVQSTYTRPGNQLGVEYTENRNLAMDFGSVSYANSVIPRIFNPFDRLFKAESLEVTQPKRIGESLNEMK